MDIATELPPGLGNKQLMFAAPHVSSGWLPINSDLFYQIKSQLMTGKYGSQVELLLEDLKSDYGLFAYCLRELSRMLSKEAPSEGFRPLQLIRTAGVARIATIFEKSAPEISRHQLSDIDSERAKQISNAMTSACTAEVLAKNQKVDPDMAFSCALFRQLGITLIAWNYPHVYKRVISTSTSNKNLDAALSRVLGFSPTLLGITLAREWGIAPEIRFVMGEKSVASKFGPLNGERLKEALILEKLCTIGETLAQLNNYDDSTGMTVEWTAAKNEIIKQIGDKGLFEINKRLNSVCKFYIKSLPDTFRLPVSTKIIHGSSARKTESLFQTNTYTQFLAPELKNELKAFYDLVKPGEIPKESIDYLVSVIIPKIGFERGCIYLADPSTALLIPRLAIGNATSSQFQSSNYQAADSKNDPILLAYRSTSPIVEKCITLEGPRLRHMAGSIGKLQRSGVLYLEPGDKLKFEEEYKTILIFKALLQAIADCLTLT